MAWLRIFDGESYQGRRFELLLKRDAWVVNGQRRRIHGLMPGDLIEIDGARLRFELSP